MYLEEIIGDVILESDKFECKSMLLGGSKPLLVLRMLQVGSFILA